MKVSVLFVCLGNICRSPSAEGVFRHLVESEGLGDAIFIDSAGTGAWHVDSPPDRRAQAEARRRGIDIGNLRGREVAGNDFERFDYVIAMDDDNHHSLLRLCPRGREDRLHYMLDFGPRTGRRNVPDPYYGGPEGFALMFDLIEGAVAGLLADIREKKGL